MVERSLSMREVPGSIPGFSPSFFFFFPIFFLLLIHSIAIVYDLLVFFFYHEQSVAHHDFRRASDTLMTLRTRLSLQQECRKTSPSVTPHRERAQLIPDATTRAAAIAKKIGKGE